MQSRAGWTGWLLWALLAPMGPCLGPGPAAGHETFAADVVVYGATAGGVVAAITVARGGHSALLVEPGQHVGGMTTAGLGATDIGNKRAIGGLAREFYRQVREHYDRADGAWRWESREAFRGGGHEPGDDCAWTFEPHVAEQILTGWLESYGIAVHTGERLDRGPGGVAKTVCSIGSIRMESGREYRARVFIDASYEGDLMAAAGVSWVVGRESNAVWGETLNGVQVARALKHQFTHAVDPFIVPGMPASGLLPGIRDTVPGPDGSGDQGVQAYCFRLCTTDVAENRREWERPADFDPLWYEVLLRNFEAGDHRVPWHPVRMPNRKTDTNNNFAVSTDWIGMNHDYAAADYATRERIVAAHRSYQQGLLWTLANEPRVPEPVRREFQKWGLARDEFVDNDNWPRQLYIREARRMVSDVVMTERHCRGTERVDDPVGLAAYTMDSHNVWRYVDASGHVRNEGDVQVGGFSPWPVSWRSIRPRQSECDNLLVPVCVSASHIAYGSLRMEPVFMVLGESAGVAASLAIETGLPVQELDYGQLRQRLEKLGQRLEWPVE